MLSVCKNLGVTPDYVFHSLSFENLLLYCHATPVYPIAEGNDDSRWSSRHDANTPGNITLPDGLVTDPF
ncbi:MAG: hypothetical protein IKP43_09255 [Bacteroidaceae bacterium]|nr:hypothetical protein [Bacteroidaceae bacterium]